MSRQYCLIFFIGLLLIAGATGDSNNECVFTLYVKTGSIIRAGTDSKISLTIGDPSGGSVWVPDLESWGLMGSTYNYFERGNLDIFTGRGPCVGAPLCRLNLTSDGTGPHSGWYCDYIEVTSTGPHTACSQTVFYVDQWLAVDAPPYKLTAILDGCKNGNVVAEHGKRKLFAVGHPIRSATA
nr:PLAT domain-containing protein 3-like [Ziziphus jujuba var. spinosa]